MDAASREAVRGIHNAVVRALSPHDRVVLAVSGGADSMVMLDAARDARSELVVATFDHGTGPAAKGAADLVRRRCGELGLRCVSGDAARKGTTEESWRRQRWDFLRRVAEGAGAVVATAHTLDDQVETVFMRILRDAGPRGLAGLNARTDVVRPMLGTRRADVIAYAAAAPVEYVDDPSNVRREHLRNRIRLDLLPAISAARPAFAGELLDIAVRAAEWREEVAAAVDHIGTKAHADGSLYVARRALEPYDQRELAILWPEIAARARVTMDRRGTHRVAAFTIDGATGSSIQLSGGIEVVRTREHFVLRRRSA
ncbi:MAG: tRNA lysidine(34) synthetase TilS [Gemmatimonadaceae bacterium]|nr:tRNA lysidine(34) synthetase TilS [Gemmatimonadaceae bacterium]